MQLYACPFLIEGKPPLQMPAVELNQEFGAGATHRVEEVGPVDRAAEGFAAPNAQDIFQVLREQEP
jgi:hypothetical protein